MLSNETITFGKYKGLSLTHVLKDRKYCKWLQEQVWFESGYEYLFNRIKDYKPLSYFIENKASGDADFVNTYPYFNLRKAANVELPLTGVEKQCYAYYLRMVSDIQNSVLERLENDDDNPYDIKAPVKWLQRFEKEYGTHRSKFKEFIDSYELPNIPYIIERVKKEGGITYNGAKSYLIAKARSEDQEKWWELILKDTYGEHLGAQFKYENCIFDFINISKNIIFECKLALKDFNEKQHVKYKLALKKYRIVYLISRDCVIDMEKRELYTTEYAAYCNYINEIPGMKSPSYLDLIIQGFRIISIPDVNIFSDIIS